MTTTNSPPITCPSWCTTDHKLMDDPTQTPGRVHEGARRAVWAYPAGGFVPEQGLVLTSAAEGYLDEESRPRRIELELPGLDGVQLDVEQARRLAHALLGLVEDVEAGR